MAVPDFVKKQIRKLSKELNIPAKQLVEQYKEIYNEDLIQEDPQLEKDKDKHQYALRVLNIEVRSGPSGKEIAVVPVGYQEERKTSSGSIQSKIYCAVDGEIKELVCKEKMASLWKDVDLFNKYDILVNEWQDALFATSGTTFQEGDPLAVDSLEYLKEELEVPQVTVKETIKNLSKTQEGSDYIDNTDWKVVEGLIIRANVGKRTDETEWGMYIVADESVPTETITSDGMVVPRQFIVWTPPSLMKYGKRSQIAVAGPIVESQSEPQMNACSVVPAGRVRPREA